MVYVKTNKYEDKENRWRLVIFLNCKLNNLLINLN